MQIYSNIYKICKYIQIYIKYAKYAKKKNVKYFNL